MTAPQESGHPAQIGDATARRNDGSREPQTPGADQCSHGPITSGENQSEKSGGRGMNHRHKLSDMRAAVSLPFNGETLQHPCDCATWITRDGKAWRRVNRSHPERPQWRLRKPEIDKDGYERLAVKGRHYLMHRLIYDLYVGPLIDGLVVCHLNGQRNDNRPENLIQATQAENISHKREHGTWQFGRKHPRAKITEQDAALVKSLLQTAARSKTGRIASGEHLRIADETGVSCHIVRDIHSKKAWSHV